MVWGEVEGETGGSCGAVCASATPAGIKEVSIKAASGPRAARDLAIVIRRFPIKAASVPPKLNRCRQQAALRRSEGDERQAVNRQAFDTIQQCFYMVNTAASGKRRVVAQRAARMGR